MVQELIAKKLSKLEMRRWVQGNSGIAAAFTPNALCNLWGHGA
jgi:hypothetical protein